jgi:hypothetical protein
MGVADFGWAAHDRRKRCRTRGAQRLWRGRRPIVCVVGHEELDRAHPFRVCITLHRTGTRRNMRAQGSPSVFVIADVPGAGMFAEMRMQATGAVMRGVVIVGVRVHERRAQRTHRKDGRQRQRQQPTTHDRHCSGYRESSQLKISSDSGIRLAKPQAHVPTA